MNELVISIMSDLNPSCPYMATSINTSNLTDIFYMPCTDNEDVSWQPSIYGLYVLSYHHFYVAVREK